MPCGECKWEKRDHAGWTNGPSLNFQAFQTRHEDSGELLWVAVCEENAVACQGKSLGEALEALATQRLQSKYLAKKFHTEDAWSALEKECCPQFTPREGEGA